MTSRNPFTCLGPILGFGMMTSVLFSACAGYPTCADRGQTCPGDTENGGAGGSSNGGSSNGGGGHGGTSVGGSSGGEPTAGTDGGGASGASGTSGAAGDGGVPCDATKSPSEESCVVGNDYAIFVAPTGKDTAAGTKAAPVKTIAKAVELAGDTKIVIACDGTYDEQVKLTTGTKLYGGFACPGSAAPWSYEASKRATVAPSAHGLALSIATGASAVVIEDFEFDAQDGTDPGESSVAAFVNASTSVALTRVKLVAGKGVDGANGSLTQVTPPDPATLDGHSATSSTGGTPNPMTCAAGGSTKGGAGGNGGGAATGGGGGTPALGGGAAGVFGALCAGPGTGGDGASAASQPPAAGATKLGAINATGWTGASGTDGAPGAPGQGGGGGTGKDMGGGGGGGAAGGCGGAGGTGGKTGGSSIALVVLNSTLTVTANDLVAGNAGKGGNGVAGQDGLPAGNGGLQAIGACPGGAGGKGGGGGAGGGAAGGVSAGTVYQGPMPTRDSATTTATGTAGTKGLGGATPTNDGIAGVKQDVLPVP